MGVLSDPMVTGGRTKIGYLFPGQGSQFIGMGRDLFTSVPEAHRAFEEANDALGFDIARMCFEGPESALQLTENAQPAILTVSIAALRALDKARGCRAELVAGHSVGEYAALVASTSLSFPDALRLARKRGIFMQEAVPPGEGAMAAILGMTREQVAAVCAEARGAAPAGDCRPVVAPANYNGPGQIVISGHAGAVGAAAELARKRGAKRAVLLKVSAPFHCELMEPAARKLEKELEPVEFRPLAVPVVSNVTGDIVTDHGAVKPLLVRQAASPVLWEECMQAMVRRGITEVIELGPGRVLSGLMKRIAPEVTIGAAPLGDGG